MTPRTTTPLTVTPLEDRCLATLIVPAAFTPLPALVDVPAKVAHLPKLDPGAGHGGPAAIGVMGLRVNHNETFVRRRRVRR